jgi:hypothetical protein
MITLRLSALPLCGALLCAAASAQVGPDVSVSRIGGSGSDYNEFGLSGGYYSYAMGTTSCNVGDAVLLWSTSGPNHPVIAQQAYWLKDGVLEQLGYAWLKHGFCALSETTCGSCQATSCSTLGIGCADTYGAGLNDSGLRDRYSVNAATGSHVDPSQGASGAHAGRVRIAQAEVADPSARYFFEAQYVAADDSQAGNHANNCSYREVSFNSPTSISSAAPITMFKPAIYAWETFDPFASVDATIVPDEGGVGVHGIFNVGFRVTDNGDGTWHYEYAVHNQTSNRAAGTFSVPIPAGVQVTNVGFHGVLHHSGSPYSNVDWTWSLAGGALTWEATETFAQDPNGNAIRWGTMYNFRFDASTGPTNDQVTIGLYEPGTPAAIDADVRTPHAPVEPGTALCFGDGSGAACPCSNESGTAGRGCLQSNGLGMRITGFGSTSVSADDLGLRTTQVAPGNTGIYYCGTVAVQSPLFDGIQCVGGDVRRFGGQFQSDGTVESSGFVAQEGSGAYFVPSTSYDFQYWSRDFQAGGSPCGQLANFSPAYSVTLTP